MKKTSGFSFRGGRQEELPSTEVCAGPGEIGLGRRASRVWLWVKSVYSRYLLADDKATPRHSILMAFLSLGYQGFDPLPCTYDCKMVHIRIDDTCISRACAHSRRFPSLLQC